MDWRDGGARGGRRERRREAKKGMGRAVGGVACESLICPAVLLASWWLGGLSRMANSFACLRACLRALPRACFGAAVQEWVGNGGVTAGGRAEPILCPEALTRTQWCPEGRWCGNAFRRWGCGVPCNRSL